MQTQRATRQDVRMHSAKDTHRWLKRKGLEVSPTTGEIRRARIPGRTNMEVYV